MFTFVLSVAIAAPPKAPPVVPDRAPPVTDSGVVVHQPAQHRREYWHGYGWVEWRDGSWWAVQAAPEVAARPFQPGYLGTNTTTAQPAVINPGRAPGRGSFGATSGRTIFTLAPSAGSAGVTNCAGFR